MYTEGLTDLKNKPFTVSSWVNQGYGLTLHRENQLVSLLGMNILEIKTMNRNAGIYPAFIAIIWGFAEIVNN